MTSKVLSFICEGASAPWGKELRPYFQHLSHPLPRHTYNPSPPFIKWTPNDKKHIPENPAETNPAFKTLFRIRGGGGGGGVQASKKPLNTNKTLRGLLKLIT